METAIVTIPMTAKKNPDNTSILNCHSNHGNPVDNCKLCGELVSKIIPPAKVAQIPDKPNIAALNILDILALPHRKGVIPENIAKNIASLASIILLPSTPPQELRALPDQPSTSSSDLDVN
jgi:hypothetical protein